MLELIAANSCDKTWSIFVTVVVKGVDARGLRLGERLQLPHFLVRGSYHLLEHAEGARHTERSATRSGGAT